MTVQAHTSLERARTALEGLSIGDAFGECFLVNSAHAESWLEGWELPPAPWCYTDDTEMALSILSILHTHRQIEQSALAHSFATHYDPTRHYGRSMQQLLKQIGQGEPWASAARAQFGGQGSYGNGAAMRAAPIGAYFAHDLDQVVVQAQRAAEVTHTHAEGIAGAIAVAVAAAWAWRMSHGATPSFASLIDLVLPYLPESEVRARLAQANVFSPGLPTPYAAALIGNGSTSSAPDTVPYAIWCAGAYLNDYAAALWNTASGRGDMDTTCAIVGGIVASRVGRAGIPIKWSTHREALPAWPFSNA